VISQVSESVKDTKKHLARVSNEDILARYISAQNYRRFGYHVSMGGKSPVLTISIVRSGLNYLIDGVSFGDVEGLFIYLRARGVTSENLMKVADGLVSDGAYTIQQE
jgi:hypothetical protein